jgi:hypothetical protein
MANDEKDLTISYYIEEVEKSDNDTDFNIEEFMNQIDEKNLEDELTVPHIINYRVNFTVKQLLLICEYYGFAKDVKSSRLNKEQIIEYLVLFENNIDNSDIVFRRQNMWFYMNELKNDIFMKKYIIW